MAPSETLYTCIDYFGVSHESVTFNPPQPGAHVLNIDCDRLNYPPEGTARAHNKRAHARLAKIVARDKAYAPEKRIDAIRVHDAGPTKAMWAIFKDLNPRHLALIGGFDETCRFKPLLTMTKWNRLESLHLGGICSPGYTLRLPPFVLRTLRSLTLDCCLDLDVRTVGGANPMLRLESLDIHSNDVGLSAAMLLKNFPSLKRYLRRLSIDSLGYVYDEEEERTGIRRVLAECTRLTDVKLVLRPHHAVDIVGFLPPSVQRVEFQGECSTALLPLMMDGWIACAKDPTWAPDLRYLELNVELGAELDYELETNSGDGDSFIWDDDPEDDDDTDAGDELDLGFDVDTELVISPETPPVSDDGLEEDADDDIDLDNLFGTGQGRPSRMGPGGERNMTVKEENQGSSQKAPSEFDKALQAKKQELFDILRSSRPGVELV